MESLKVSKFINLHGQSFLLPRDDALGFPKDKISKAWWRARLPARESYPRNGKVTKDFEPAFPATLWARTRMPSNQNMQWPDCRCKRRAAMLTKASGSSPEGSIPGTTCQRRVERTLAKAG